MDAETNKRLIRELEQIQTIGHLLQKAGEADAVITMSGWALEGAGRMIVDSASEIREALDEEKDEGMNSRDNGPTTE